MNKINVICSECGGSNDHLDAWADFDIEAQQWVLGNTFDYSYCDDCQNDCRTKEIEIT